MSNDNAKVAGTATGAVGGGLLGAALGKQSGHAGEGALLGAAGGALVGNQNGANWFGGDGSIESTQRER